MPINFKSKLSSAVANATFLDKTQNDETVGILSLKSSAPASGNDVVNPQGYINEIASTSGIDFFGDPNGTVYSSENYITDGDSRKVAIGKLDAQAQVNADNVVLANVEILKNTPLIVANELISAAGTISIDPARYWQKRKISGDGTPVTVTSLLFGVDPSAILDGTEITLIGTDAVNTVKILFADVQYGSYQNGNIELGFGHIAVYIWDASLERFLGKTRNI